MTPQFSRILHLPVVVEKMWCLFVFFTGRIAARRQNAGIKFTHRPKIRVSAPQGRLVAPIHVNLGRANGHVSPLSCAKFHPNRPRAVGMRPQKYENFPFFGESPRRGEPLDRFLKFLRPFTRPTILHSPLKFDSIRFTVYEVIAEKPRVGHLGQIFPCTL